MIKKPGSIKKRRKKTPHQTRKSEQSELSLKTSKSR